MNKIKAFDKEFSADEYVHKLLICNFGDKSYAYKESLIFLAEKNKIETKELKTKEQLVIILSKKIGYSELARVFKIGIRSRSYQETFNLTKQAVKYLENHQLITVVGFYSNREFKTRCPLYDVYEYESMTKEKLEKLLLGFKGKKWNS